MIFPLFRGGFDVKNEEFNSSQGEFTVKEIGESIHSRDMMMPSSVTKKGIRYFKSTSKNVNHHNKTKIDKEVGPESDKNISVNSSNVFLDGSMNTGGGEISQDEPSVNFFNSRIINQKQNTFKKPMTTTQSPHYMVMNDTQFSIGSPRYQFTSGTNRHGLIMHRRTNNFSLNINKNNNQQVFTT